MAQLTVDLDAAAANFHTLRREAGGAEVAPVVKADGYGMGAVAVARRLLGEGAERLFVARAAEGFDLRRALGFGPRIHVLDGCDLDTAEGLAAARLTPVLNTLAQVAAWSGAGGGEAAVMLDTGLNRLGLTGEESAALAASPDRLRGVDVTLVMSHLACADQPDHSLNAAQRDRFVEAAALFPGVPRSLAASDGLFLGPDYAFDLVRTGIGLYGGGPRGATDPRFRVVATLEAPVLQVRTVRRGEAVGYGATFTAQDTMRVAVAAAGYADGVLRASAPDAYGSLRGRRVRRIGRISMDLMAFDVTDDPQAREGDRIQIVGPDVPLDDAARWAGSIAYELLTRLGGRAERRYVGEVGGEPGGAPA